MTQFGFFDPFIVCWTMAEIVVGIVLQLTYLLVRKNNAPRYYVRHSIVVLAYFIPSSKCQARLRDTLMRLICFQCWEQSLFNAVLLWTNIVQFILTKIRDNSPLEALPLSPRLCGPE